MAQYPGAVYTTPTRDDADMSASTDHETWHDEAVDEIRAIQTELGTTPSGSFATVVARLDAYGSGAAISWLNAPVGNIDATTSGSTVTWLTTAITVPTWASTAIVHADVTNVTAITAAALYALDLTISGGSYTGDFAAINFAATAALESVGFTRLVTGFSTGVQNVLVGARRVSGSGTMRATTTSKISGFIIFLD